MCGWFFSADDSRNLAPETEKQHWGARESRWEQWSWTIFRMSDARESRRKRRNVANVLGPRPPLLPAVARATALEVNARAAILVEGWSDQAAVETLAQRRGLVLRSEGVLTVPMGGVTNLGAFVRELGAGDVGLRLAGLCDAAEEVYVSRTLEQAGMGRVHRRVDLEAIGFFVCEADLEDELIRALGLKAVETMLSNEGELNSFRRFQEQPAQRERTLQAQLHRFMGTRATRKIRYGALLTGAIDLARVPRALNLVIEHALAGSDGNED
jgi:hypothetical protein